MRNYLFFLLLFGLFSEALAKHSGTRRFTNAPWFTGPLLAPSAHVTPGGKCNIEPYFVMMDKYGSYDENWKLQKREHDLFNNIVETYVTVGITDWMDFAVIPIVSWNVCHGKQAFHVCEVRTGFNFQIITDTEDNYLPAIKVGVRETLPIGKINHLNPNKYGVDVGRFVDTYQTEFFTCASRLFHLRGDIWLNVRLALAYFFYTRVHVAGHNAYGGAADTDGFIYPPQNYGFDFAWEINLSKHWAFACDIVGGYATKRRFKGHPGMSGGVPAVMTKGSAVNYHIAPAIEYNWNDFIGVISGADFSISGRNSSAFASWMTGVNMYF